MVDYINHWATLCVCTLCGKIPESAPLYHCPFQHQYCFKCYQELRRNYRGSIENGCYCKICNASAKFEKTNMNSEFLKKLQVTPGIGRPFRYDTNPFSKNLTGSANEHKLIKPKDEVTVETLFGLSKAGLKELFDGNNGGDVTGITVASSVSGKDYTESAAELEGLNSVETHSNLAFPTISRASFTQSRKPIMCPHHPCKKMIAVSAFVNHFRFEHSDITRISVEKGKGTMIPCDLSSVEFDTSFCLAIITVYQINRMDLVKSRSTHSVIRTCNKFCQKVPVDTFWLMLSGSQRRKKALSYLLLWLFSNSNEKYKATIELSSTEDNISVSSVSDVNSVPEDLKIEEIAKSLRCLCVSHGSVVGLLQDGPELNLRVTVH